MIQGADRRRRSVLSLLTVCDSNIDVYAQTDRQKIRDRQTNISTARQIDRHTQTDRQADRKTEAKIDRQKTDTQTDRRQTHRQAERHKYTHGKTDGPSSISINMNVVYDRYTTLPGKYTHNCTRYKEIAHTGESVREERLLN